ncbi:MAG: hypothetical protein LZF86_110303 [Nitrospira sp.]|nr:MAG: hypothetical protein LZF86_110303 [Nitrospira sp.]
MQYDKPGWAKVLPCERTAIRLDGNHLRGLVCAATWHAASGAQGAPPSSARDGSTRPHPDHDVNCCAPGRNQRTNGAEPLGRRPPQREPKRLGVGTLVERTPRLVLLARMEGTDTVSAREGFTKTLRHVPAPLRKTLTYDRGKEMAEHDRLVQGLAIQVFFADPHNLWQRGPNENTNWRCRGRVLERVSRESGQADIEEKRRLFPFLPVHV